MSDMDAVTRVTEYLEAFELRSETRHESVSDVSQVARSIYLHSDTCPEGCVIASLTYGDLDTLRGLALKAINAREALG